MTLDVQAFGGERTPPSRASNPAKCKIIGLCLLDIREPLWDNSRSGFTMCVAFHPDLEHARHVIRPVIEPKRIVWERHRRNEVEETRNRLLHAGLREGSRQDEGNPLGLGCCMTNELLGKRGLATKGRIPKDHAVVRKINGQEVGALDPWMTRLDIIAHRTVYQSQEGPITCRGFDPCRSARYMLSQEVHAEACNLRTSVELIFRITPKSSVLPRHEGICLPP